MKKFLSFFATLALALGFTACEDVPAPFAINDEGGTQTGFYYMSNNLSSGWTLKEVEGKGQPWSWSQGSSYVQATGYQKWDGAEQKSNKEVEGWLISPAFNTAGAQKLKFSFDYTIKYTNNVPNTWKGNHRVLVSTDYNGGDVNSATWTEINVNLVESPHSDWTTYTSGEIQLPDEFVGAENLRIAFWFYAPASGSTTWELQNFVLEEGEAVVIPDDSNPEGFPYMSANLKDGWSIQQVEGKGQPWSQGSSYVQATGYQKWDGADQKSNKEVEGWLISPAFNTSGIEKLKFSFDYTIKYTNNVATWKGNHKVLASKDYNGVDVNSATWTEINVNLVESPHSDWTTYTSGEIQLPDEFVGSENLRIAFWFYAPASGSTTWELQNFKLEEGEAETTPGDIKSNYKFVKATSIEEGKQYLFVADGKMAGPISSTYGYLTSNPVGIKEDYIVVKGLTNAFTIKVDKTSDISGYSGLAYNIIQSDGRMLWAEANMSRKNFNVDENPSGDKAWIISSNQDGTFLITCGNVGRFMQYSKQYNSFGCYSEEQPNAFYPNLYVLVGETDEEVTQPSGDTPGTGGDTPTPVTGENLLKNGDFESWTSGLPDNWKSTNSASTATLTQSTDAHGGSYSVSVGSQTSGNKRLAYKEITLKAGKYTMQFYAKGGQCRPGYVPTKDDGSLGGYSYGGYATLKANEWTLVSHEFSLSAQTTVNLVVMNPQSNSGQNYTATNMLVDDFTLTTNDGGLVDGQ